ncbi:MAG: arabinogalactan endo-1,4-beta-galactosidase [Prevotella sp.]|nr:arabinogalactan endo-1,4-beta-galactosidase [Prevotella sp.]
MKNFYVILFSAITMLIGVNIHASADDFNSSDYFQNLDFESCSKTNGNDYYDTCDGWTLDYTTFMSSNASNIWPKDYDSSWMPSNMSGVILFAWADGSATAASGTQLCCQKSTQKLPAGVYTVSALICSVQDGISLYAINDNTNEEFTTVVSKSDSETAAVTATTLEITLTSAAYLEIGFKANTPLTYSGNLYVDNFTVTQTSVLEDENESSINSTYFSNLDFDSCTLSSDNGSSWYDPIGWTIYYNNTNSQKSFSTYEPRAYDSSWMPSNMSGIVLYGWGDSSITIDNNAKLCYQTSSSQLPAGTYKVSALICSLVDGISLYAIDNTTNNEVVQAVTASSSTSDATAETSLTITLENDAFLEIGFKTTSSITYNGNFFADEFSVTETTSTNEGEENQNPDDNSGETVVSSEFTNLDFESCTWIDSQTEGEEGWFEDCPAWTLNYDYFFTNWPKTCDEYYSDLVANTVLVVWDNSHSIAADTKVCSQTATMEAGKYTVSVIAHADGTGNFALYATAGDNMVTSFISNSGSDNWANAAKYSVTIELTEKSSLEIGIIATAAIDASSNAVNLYADNFSVALASDDDENQNQSEGGLSDDVLRVVGGDISLVPAYETASDDWLDAEGFSITGNYDDGIITYLRDVAGWTSMRVRLLVDPTVDDNDTSNDYLATCQDLDYVKALGKRIKDAGMYFLLDIFYSDTWTDVSQQWIPTNWTMDKNTATETIAAKVKSYTTDVINQLVAYGAAPDYVQIGNEVSYGMLWDSYTGQDMLTNYFYLSGSYSTLQTQKERFAALLTAAAEGVRVSNDSTAKIVLHSERTINSTYSKNFYDWVEKAGFTDYDVIGLSYYPAWQGSIDNLKATLSTLTSAYPSKEIQIVETGYYNTNDVSLDNDEKSYCTWELSPAGQASFLSDLASTLNSYTNVTGLYYWQPEECGNGADSDGNNRVKYYWDNRGFWDISWKSQSHQLTSADALMTLQKFNHTALDISTDNTTTETTDISSTCFTNLDFESCTVDNSGIVTDYSPWTLSDKINTNKPTTDSYASSLTSNYLLEVWEGTNTISSGTKVCSQTSKVEGNSADLPAGTYTVTAVVHADGSDQFALFASANSTTVTSKIKNSYSGSDCWADAATYKVTIELTEASTLEIGIITTGDIAAATTAVNLYADNFKVTQTIASNSESGDTDGISEINAAPATNAIYNIQGIRMNDMSKKGIYIVNGKKVLVR